MTIKERSLLLNLQSAEEFVERVMGKETVVAGAPRGPFFISS